MSKQKVVSGLLLSTAVLSSLVFYSTSSAKAEASTNPAASQEAGVAASSGQEAGATSAVAQSAEQGAPSSEVSVAAPSGTDEAWQNDGWVVGKPEDAEKPPVLYRPESPSAPTEAPAVTNDNGSSAGVETAEMEPAPTTPVEVPEVSSDSPSTPAETPTEKAVESPAVPTNEQPQENKAPTAPTESEEKAGASEDRPAQQSEQIQTSNASSFIVSRPQYDKSVSVEAKQPSDETLEWKVTFDTKPWGFDRYHGGYYFITPKGVKITALENHEGKNILDQYKGEGAPNDPHRLFKQGEGEFNDQWGWSAGLVKDGTLNDWKAKDRFSSIYFVDYPKDTTQITYTVKGTVTEPALKTFPFVGVIKNFDDSNARLQQVASVGGREITLADPKPKVEDKLENPSEKPQTPVEPSQPTPAPEAPKVTPDAKPEEKGPQAEQPEVEKTQPTDPMVDQPIAPKEGPEAKQPDMEQPQPDTPEVDKSTTPEEKPQSDKPEVKKPEAESPQPGAPEVDKTVEPKEAPEAEQPQPGTPEVDKSTTPKEAPQAENPEAKKPEVDQSVNPEKEADKYEPTTPSEWLTYPVTTSEEKAKQMILDAVTLPAGVASVRKTIIGEVPLELGEHAVQVRVEYGDGSYDVALVDVRVVAEQTAPDTQTPQDDQPKAKVPDTKEPQVDQPEAKEPDMKEPDMKEPRVDQPKAKKPDMKAPQVDQPKAKEPRMDTPPSVRPNVQQGNKKVLKASPKSDVQSSEMTPSRKNRSTLPRTGESASHLAWLGGILALLASVAYLFKGSKKGSK